MAGRILHTDMPMPELTLLVGDLDASATIDITGRGKRACFYGWGEAMADAIHCKPHHLVSHADPDFLRRIAKAIYDMGWQVVLSDYEVWSEAQTVLRYDDHHSH